MYLRVLQPSRRLRHDRDCYPAPINSHEDQSQDSHRARVNLIFKPSLTQHTDKFSRPPAGYDTTTTATETVTATAACPTDAKPTVAVCRRPSTNFHVGIQNFGSTYLASSSDSQNTHDTLVLTQKLSSALNFTSDASGQGSYLLAGGANVYSNQAVGNEPIYFDALSNANGGYQSGDDAVQFCLQTDDTFIVQNPTNGATTVAICSGTIYLFTDQAAATSGCTIITLIMAST